TARTHARRNHIKSHGFGGLMRFGQLVPCLLPARLVITRLSSVFFVLLALAAAPAFSQTPSGSDDDAALQLAEPDYRVINLPTTLRLPVHKSNFQLTHRFNGNLRRGSFSDNASNLFGLDQGAVVGFEYRFAVVRHVQAAVYRTAIDKTFQFYGKYDAVRQSHSMPVSLSALLSIEGADNFQERYSPALGVTASRMVADRLALYATPIWVHNTA